MKRQHVRGGWPLLVPVAVAMWPALFIAGSNPGEFSGAELLVAAALAAATGAVCTLLALAVTRRPAAAMLGGILLTAAMYTPTLLAVIRRSGVLGDGAHGPALPALFALVVLLLLLRLRGAGDAVAPSATPVALGAATLVMLAAIQSGRSVWQAREVHAAPPVRPAIAAASDTLPDIYLIVLDQYAASPVLQRVFGFDNGTFEDSLARLGFRIPATSWTNYPYTAASVASMLGMRHVADAAEPGGGLSLLPFFRIISEGEAFSVARRHGYRTIFVPSPDFAGTRTHPGVDRVIVSSRGDERLADYAASPLVTEVVRLTVVDDALKAADVRLGGQRRALAPFRGIAAAIMEPGPKFVFAHVMVTHEPFHFTADCSAARIAEERFVAARYPDQVACTNRQLLSAIRAILASGRPSVIVLQADHGPSTLGGRDLADPRAASAAQVAEQLHGFSAYRLPDGGVLADTVTPVNTLRRVFNRHLGTSFPILADEAYYATVGRVYDFVPVDLRAAFDPAGPATASGSGIARTRR